MGRDAGLHGRLPQDDAVVSQKAAKAPVGHHQRIRQPQQAHIHGLIKLVDEKHHAELFPVRDADAVLQGAAQGAPRELRHRKQGIHGGGKARDRAEKGHQYGSIALGHPIGDRHIGKQAAHPFFFFQIGKSLPQVSGPTGKGIAFPALPPAFLQADAAFGERRRQGQAPLDQQQHRHAQNVQQHRRQRRDDHVEHRVQHGGYRVALVLCPRRDQLRIDAGERQLIHGAQAGQHHGNAQIAHIGKIEKQQPQAHGAVKDAVADVSAHQKGLSRQAVHQQRHRQRHKNIGRKLGGHHQRGGQRAARLVKHQKGQGESAGNSPGAAQRGGQRHQTEIPCPQFFLHAPHLLHKYSRGLRQKKPGIFGKNTPKYAGKTIFKCGFRENPAAVRTPACTAGRR